MFCWIEAHPGLASWVQAVGTILAVLAAVWIAQRQSREANRLLKKQEKAKTSADLKSAHILARRLASILIDIEIQIQDSQKLLPKLPTLRTPFDKGFLDYVFHLMLFKPTWDEAIFARFDLLPTEAADVTAHLLYSTLVYNRTVRTLLQLVADGHGDLSRTHDSILERQRTLIIDLENAKQLLAPLVTTMPS